MIREIEIAHLNVFVSAPGEPVLTLTTVSDTEISFTTSANSADSPASSDITLVVTRDGSEVSSPETNLAPHQTYDYVLTATFHDFSTTTTVSQCTSKKTFLKKNNSCFCFSLAERLHSRTVYNMYVNMDAHLDFPTKPIII